ncbi:MAG: hypothetical protein NT010_04850 [Proteobacteria bacterium]|nr:hypothetical protein [Pseudomonadota bacterium]
MKDQEKTAKQLIQKLESTHRYIKEFEPLQLELAKGEKAFVVSRVKYRNLSYNTTMGFFKVTSDKPDTSINHAFAIIRSVIVDNTAEQLLARQRPAKNNI